jgi:xylulose-5-phosphate/fructose-6-phosphate phosphoketolase
MKTCASKKSAVTEEELWRMDAYWRSANYLSVSQIYLHVNPFSKNG